MLVVQPAEKSPFGRPRNRWRDNIKVEIMEVGLESVNWTYMAEDKD